MADEYLAIADAAKIHDYVFSPHELRLIKGGSYLQSHMQEVLRNVVREQGGKCISANGGTVVAKFPGEGQARTFCQKAQCEYRARTSAATVTTAFVPYPNGRWPESKKQLDDRIEAEKHSAPQVRFNGSSPFWTICQACGLYPAAHAHYAGPDRRWICQACHLRKKGSQNPPEWLGDLEGAETFEEIGKAASPANYMALVYVDLDRLGRFMDCFGKSEDAWTALSGRIESALRAGVIAGRAKIGFRTKFQVLLAGGDDAIVVLPADKVFAYLEGFESGFHSSDLPSNEANGISASYSAGVLIAHSHYPIFEFRRLAEELLRSAKQIERANSVFKPNSVDFEILTASMTDSILEERDRAAGRTLGPRRTARPYTIDEFLELEQKARRLKNAGLPSSRVKSLYAIAYEGDLQADLDYLYLLSRLERGQKDALRAEVGGHLFRTGAKGAMVTEVTDLVEIWDFVHDTQTDD